MKQKARKTGTSSGNSSNPSGNPSGKSYRRKLAALLFLGMLGIFFLLELIPLQQDYSKKEGRALETRPALSLEGIADGTFMERYEAYRSDQFIGRSLWALLCNRLDLLMGKRESNGVFKGKDGYLLEKIAAPDPERLDGSLKAMKAFRERYGKIPMYLMLAPDAANILKEKLPRFAVTEDQDQTFDGIRQELGEGITWVDVRKALAAHKKEEIYYRTDSHWTTLGAYYAFLQLAETMGLDAAKTPEWERYVVTNIFSGNLSVRSGYQAGEEESIYIYTPKNENEVPQIVVEYVDDGKKNSTLYDRSKLKETDAYALFMGGDQGTVDIRTTADTTARLLVVKDSSANCLIPFLTPYYREVIVIDPAYYQGSLDKIMRENKISGVLFLYSGNTFVQDDRLSGVLGNGKTQQISQ